MVRICFDFQGNQYPHEKDPHCGKGGDTIVVPPLKDVSNFSKSPRLINFVQLEQFKLRRNGMVES